MDPKENMVNLSFFEYIVFVVVLLGSSLVGIYYAWKGQKEKQDTKQYLTGGENKNVMPVALSLVASLLSSISVLGIPAEVFAHSIQYWLSNLASIIGIVVTTTVFLPVLHPLKLISVNKYLLKRFNYPSLRVVSSLAFILSNVLVSGAVVYGPALAISSVTPMSLTTSIITVGLVCTFYTTVGGMKAVIWTDVLQLIIMVAGMLMVAIQGTIKAGGTAQVWRTAYDNNLIQVNNWRYDPVYGAPTLWETSLGMLVLWAGTFSTNQMCVQRYCSLPTLKKARLCMYISIPFTAAFLGISCYCGVAIFANYYNCDPLLLGHITKADQLMPYFVVDALGYIPGLSGLFIAAVFSGSLSTLSSALNSMTILTWDDFFKKFCKVPAKIEIIITKAIAVSYGLITIGIAFVAQRMGSVLDMVLMLSGAIVGPQLGTFFLGALCPFANGKSVMASFIIGEVCCMGYNVYVAIVKRPVRRLPTSIDGCSGSNIITSGFLMNETINSTFSSILMDEAILERSFSNATQYRPVDEYHSTLLYISPFFMPFMGWGITTFSGIIISLLTGGADMDSIDPAYVSPVIRRFIKAKKAKGSVVNGISNDAYLSTVKIPTISEIQNQQQAKEKLNGKEAETNRVTYL